MKKVAPPGRRAAPRVKKFTAEEEDVQPIQTATLDEQGEEQQQQHEEQPQESEELQHATNASQEDAAEQEQRQSTGSMEQSNGHSEELSAMTHAAARTYGDNEDVGDDAEDVDDAEDEQAKAQALAMQQEAERLASQIKAEQEAAQARRSQRLKFLGDVDDFVGTLQKEIASQPAQTVPPADVVAQALQDASKSYQPPPAASVPSAAAEEEEPESVRLVKREVVEPELAVVQEREQPQQQQWEPAAAPAATSNAFSALASKLFADEPAPTTTIDLASDASKAEEEDWETKQGDEHRGSQPELVLSRPKKIGMLEKKTKHKESASAAAAAPAAVAAPAPGPAAVAPAENGHASEAAVQQSQSDRATDVAAAAKTNREKWMASQEDLHKHRSEFHGAVTYAFDGVFSWQMYGVTNATEPDGSPYTEYIMRCQWGPDFDSLRPWMVARRFREFDLLDEQLRAQYPDLKGYLPPIPPKELFANMSPEVVEKRKRGLEAYMTHIVTSVPTILRGPTMDRFLNISNRIRALQAEMGLSPPASAGRERGVRGDEEVKGTDVDEANFAALITSDDAQRACDEQNVPPLDYVGVGAMEEAVRSLSKKVQSVSPRTVTKDTELLSLVRYTQTQWPALKAACKVTEHSNLDLVPRALQCDEDLQRALAEYKSILAVRQLQGGIVA